MIASDNTGGAGEVKCRVIDTMRFNGSHIVT